MSIDPYATPVAGAYADSKSNAITQGVVQALLRTKPWVRFISVMIFIGAALMLLGGLVMALGVGFAGMKNGANAFGPTLGPSFGIMLGAIYAVIAILYIYPAVKLWKYASRIGDLAQSGQAVDLEAALNEQRAFWKFFGVILALFLGLYALIAVVAIIAAVAGATR
jgi:NADH:ubiquinone oxidoreductase subunit 6 (subunit J)